MSSRPLGNDVIIKLDLPSATAGKILIPEVVKRIIKTGTIIAVGPGIRNKEGKRLPMEIEKGDVVVFNKFHGRVLSVSERLVLLSSTDLLAVMEAIEEEVA